MRTLALVATLALSLTAAAQNPQVPDYIYARRLEHLNQLTPIALEYNSQVRAYIDVYLERRRDHLANILGRSELYFPIFEECLSRYNLPLELKYLAVIESALDPRAQSKSGAMGLWQFLYNAGVMMDLRVTTYEDDRCDVRKSTDAACRYLLYLFQNLGDWQLALAAYNGGLGQVQKARQRAGQDKQTFWEIAPYMTPEMQAYVPAFIAVNYVMNFYRQHNVSPARPQWTANDIDTVYVNKSLGFDQIARAAGVSKETLELLNPQYVKDFVPYDDAPRRLTLPAVNIAKWLHNERRLQADREPQLSGYFRATTFEPAQLTHTVAKGEYLHKIAMAYATTADKIVEWNSLPSKDLRVGQRLTIHYQRQVRPFFFVTEEVGP